MKRYNKQLELLAVEHAQIKPDDRLFFNLKGKQLILEYEGY